MFQMSDDRKTMQTTKNRGNREGYLDGSAWEEYQKSVKYLVFQS